MREPRFWARDVDPKSREAAPLMRFLLTPLSWLYAEVTKHKIASANPHKVSAKVICVGNLTAGGVGKSPVVIALRNHFSSQYTLRVATLSRGYKGQLKGPLKVDLSQHTAADVGDEPLMLAASGETWIGADRAKAGQTMAEDGVNLIIMDDGHQNPGLHKDLSLIVVDSHTGFGNGHVIPKGPLRERATSGLMRADALIVMGDGSPPPEIHESGLPVFNAGIKAKGPPPVGPYVAFAGIGRPEKFFDTLTNLNVDILDAIPFPDHHTYTRADLDYLKKLASDHQATLITTEKDYVRLSPQDREGVLTLPIEVQFKQRVKLDSLLNNVINSSDE